MLGDADDRQVPLIAVTTEAASSGFGPLRRLGRPGLHACGNGVTFGIVAVACLLPVACGYTLGYTSPNLDEMAHSFDPPLTSLQRALFSSLVNAGAMASSLAAGQLTDALGRKFTMGLVGAAGLCGWAFIAQGVELGPWVLMTGRIITGCAAGGAAVAVNVFISEIAPDDKRGALGASFQVSVTLGIFLVYALGTCLSWRMSARVGGALYAALLAGLTVLPESPRWLLMKARDATRARRVLVCIRGGEEGVDHELARMLQGVDAPESAPHAAYTPPSERLGPPSTADAVLEADEAHAGGGLCRPLSIAVGLMAGQQLSGINVVIFYAQPILQDSHFSGKGSSAALAIGGAQLLITAASASVMDAIGRRTLLLAAASGMGVSQTIIAVFFLTGSHTPALALVGLCGAVASYSVGLGSVPWSLMSELFPMKVRGLASSVASLTNWAISFIVTLAFPPAINAIGEGGVFAFFSATCAATILFTAAYVPETKGRSLEEIERAFRTGSATSDLT